MIPLLRNYFAQHGTVIEELDVGHGRVDLCAYVCDQRRQPISRPALRLFSKLANRYIDLNALTFTLVASIPVLLQYARELERHGLIQRTGTRVRRVRSYRYPVRKLIAVEAKLGDWQKACEQVSLHQPFADELWIALDVKNIARVDAEFIRQRGIGAIAVDKDGAFIMQSAAKNRWSRAFSVARAIVHESILESQTSGRHDDSCIRAAGFTSIKPLDWRKDVALASQVRT